MSRREPLVDIHCHLLPGLDDGAASWDEALRMAEMAAADGVGTIIATPHQLGSHAGNSAAVIRTAAERLQQAIGRQGLPLRVLPGADVRIEPDLVEKIRRGDVLILGRSSPPRAPGVAPRGLLPAGPAAGGIGLGGAGRNLIPSRAESRHPESTRHRWPPGRARLLAASDRGEPDRGVRAEDSGTCRVSGRGWTRPFCRHRRPRNQRPPAGVEHGLPAGGEAGGRRGGVGSLLSEPRNGGGRRPSAAWTPPGKKGDRSNLPERPAGCFAQIGPVPFFPRGVKLAARAGFATGLLQNRMQKRRYRGLFVSRWRCV